MRTFELKPYVGLNNLFFGMKCNDVRYICGNYRNYPSGFPVENHSTDDFGYIHGFYTPDKKLEALAIFPGSILEYKGISLEISEDANEVINELKKWVDDFKYLSFDESYYSEKLGMMIYCPEGIIENVLIYSKHYYDEENEYLMEHFGTTKFNDD